MNNFNKYQLADRSSYSLFILNKKQDVYEYLKSFYPAKVDKKNVYIINNQHTKICLVFKNIDDCKEKIIPTIYTLNNNPHYTGKLFITDGNENELLELKNGELISSTFSSTNEQPADSKPFYINRFNAKSKDFLNLETKQQKITKISICILCFLLGIFVFSKISSFYIQKQNQKKIETEKLLQEEQKLLEQKKKDAEKLESLKQKYVELKNNEYIDIYDSVSIIYRNLEKYSKIENLSIEKNTFELDLHTTNALNVLGNFEEDPLISQIKMNRTVLQNSREYVIYSGIFGKQIEYLIPDQSIQNQIEAYERLFEQSKNINTKLLSEYVSELRKSLLNANCKEEYLSVKLNDDIIYIELSINASKTNIFNFLQANKNNTNKKNIKTARFKSMSNGNLNTTLVFDTQINKETLKKEAKDSISQLEQILPSEIAVKFGTERTQQSSSTGSSNYSRNISSVTSNKTSANTNLISAQTVKNIQVPKLYYVGKAGTDSLGTYIFVKEQNNDNLIKLLVKNKNDKKGNYCFIDENGNYIAYYKGFETEVLNGR